VTFDKTAPCARDVFESAGDKEMEDSIFIDEDLQGLESDEDERVAPASTSSTGHVPTSTIEAEAPQAANSSSVGVHASGIEGGSTSRVEPHPTFKRHIHLNKS
jgi:hypothetical protein